MPDQYQDYADWASGVINAGEGELILTHEEIEAIVDARIALLGELHTDPGEIPSSATARPRGAFTDPNDMENYLSMGGLVTYDGNGNPTPIGIVHILKIGDFDSDNDIYEVWIDEDSPEG